MKQIHLTSKAVKAIALGLIFATYNSYFQEQHECREKTFFISFVTISSLLSGVLISAILMGAPENTNNLPAKIILNIQNIFGLIDLRHSALALASGFAALLSTVFY